MDRVFTEITRLKDEGPSDKDLADVKEILVREFESGSLQNGFLMNQIAGRTEAHEDLESLFHIPDVYRAITAADIQTAATTYFDTKRYVKVTLFPEK